MTTAVLVHYLSMHVQSVCVCMYASVTVCISVYCVPVQSVGLSSVFVVGVIF